MKIQKSFFITITIVLLTIRSPLIIPAMIIYAFLEIRMLNNMMVKLIPFLIFIMVMDLYSLSASYGVKTVTDILGQSRDILLACVVFIFLLAASEVNKKNPQIIYESFKVCLTMVGIAKVCVTIFIAATGLDPGVFIDFMNSKFGLGMMSLSVDDSSFFRLQIPLDSLLPLMMYFIVKEAVNTSSGRFRIYFALTFLCISALLTMSRLIWVETLVIIFIALLKEAKLSTLLKVLFVVFALVTSILVLTPLGDSLSLIISTRFGKDASALNAGSDIARTLQDRAILEAFANSPIMGNGLGYYLPNFLRSTSEKYLYESQTLSMLMDVGIMGCTIFLLIILYINIRSALNDGGGIGMPLLFLVFWLLAGTYNPFLFGVAGGGMLFMSAKFHSFYRPSNIS